MAVRQPPTLLVPHHYAEAVSACMGAKPLQHQDELVALLTWLDDLTLRPRTIVEIGSFRGGTLELWARLADLVISIDLDSEHFFKTPPADMAALMDARDQRFAERFPHVLSVRGNSHADATKHRLQTLLDGRSIDLLFIDGDHTYAGVAQDFHMYGPLVAPGGVIAFHDTLWCDTVRVARDQFGVPEFFDRLQQIPRHRTVRYECGGHWGGIGALVVQPDTFDTPSG